MHVCYASNVIVARDPEPSPYSNTLHSTLYHRDWNLTTTLKLWVGDGTRRRAESHKQTAFTLTRLPCPAAIPHHASPHHPSHRNAPRPRTAPIHLNRWRQVQAERLAEAEREMVAVLARASALADDLATAQALSRPLSRLSLSPSRSLPLPLNPHSPPHTPLRVHCHHLQRPRAPVPHTSSPLIHNSRAPRVPNARARSTNSTARSRR